MLFKLHDYSRNGFKNVSSLFSDQNLKSAHLSIKHWLDYLNKDY